MRTKNFIIILCSVVTISFIVIIFGQQKPDSIQTFVSTTHQQIRNFQDNLREAESKTLVADEKYLNLLGFNANPRLYPQDVWKNTSLPVIVTYVMEGQESQAFGLINNVARVLPNNTVLIYNLGLGNYGLKTLNNYCNNSRCQILSFDLSQFPSHIADETLHAFRPIIIQDALQAAGSVLFLECSYRFTKQVSRDIIVDLYETNVKKQGILAWPLKSKNPVSSLTHKKMFEYFHTDAENFLFLPMVDVKSLFIINTKSIHQDIMLPWVQCALTQDCIVPIGAQSAGCKYDKKPIYRYSGCHSYDISSLNIVLGLKFKLDNSFYAYNGRLVMFENIPLNRAIENLKEFEQNATTTEGRFSPLD